ncbi:ATP-dependent DNA helicase [uncultured Herbaspirillum sp.]|uniref:ATP-dependent DNA helicase n=1 Tax=uncultured Herbaspirillum sp. TaxID=160236 RepID=UPI002633912A|nr:ATP-dependent DNA helicase [uncultured Herbaspirillum sp.]
MSESTLTPIVVVQDRSVPRYTVSVRALCEFTAKAGDLDLRFTPTPTAREGMAGHLIVAQRRGQGYQSEVNLSAQHGALHVRGRADGYDPMRTRLEEVKTYRGQLASLPDNHRHLHWAQLRVYGHLMCEKLGLAHIHLALVYFDIGSQQETLLEEIRSREELAALFAAQCERFMRWAEQELAHRHARDAALQALRFPHGDFRPGQRQLAEAVFRAHTARRSLLAQAPTGIGKTLGTLFPALKAAPLQRLDKIFFLAAKTSGRQLALDAATTLKEHGRLPLRVLELCARDKSCEYPDRLCRGDSCPLAQGFYDRLPAARAACLTQPLLDRDQLRSVALQHQVCPYYLGSEMTRWSDLIVGDYNYWFDGGAMLYAMAQAHDWRVSVLADEAHNLVSRARSMYSAQLSRAALRAARAVAPPAVAKPLERLGRAWTATGKKADLPYQVLEAPPARLVEALAGSVGAISDYLAQVAVPLEAPLRDFYFDAMAFVRLAESFGPHSLFDLTREDERNTVLCIRNVVPAPFLGARFACAHATILFSATLAPWNYFADLLGMPASTAWVDVASPFQASQLQIRVAHRIATTWQRRAASIAPIGELMARQYAERPGNYLAFFSSFDYLQQAHGAFAQAHPEIPTWQQSRRMSETDRDAFLARFERGGQGIGFAVLGGSFGEGVDLPGERLIGAFVATLGLPQFNPVNEQMRQRMEQLFGCGYDYAYLYPGMQKVVQAAGRVIRTESDYGTVWLIDQRFGRPEVQALLPAWWQLDPPSAATPRDSR